MIFQVNQIESLEPGKDAFLYLGRTYFLTKCKPEDFDDPKQAIDRFEVYVPWGDDHSYSGNVPGKTSELALLRFLIEREEEKM